MVVIRCEEMMYEGLAGLWQTGLFSDIEVCIGCLKLQAHRVILSAHSPVFQAMFTNDMMEASTRRVDIQSGCPQVFQTIIEFMYHGTIDIDRKNVRDVMYIADQLLMRKLVDICCDFMYRHLDIRNCVDVMQVAQAHSCGDLEKAALNFICQNLSRVSSTSSFLDLELTEVTSLLDTKELPCSNEEDVLQAALRWITHDVVSRKRHSFYLLSSVRFRSITLKDLDRAVISLIPTQDPAFSVVIASLRKDLETGHLFKNPRFSKPKRGSKYILIFGGANMDSYQSGSGSPAVYRYDVINNTWTELESCTVGRYKHAVTVIGDRVYLLGGNNEFFSVTSSVESYNITTGSWCSMCPMLECRREPQVTVVNGRMYVTSSDENEGITTPIEVYDPSDDMWHKYISNLGWEPANSSASICHQDKFYELICGKKRSFLRVTPLYLDSDPYSRLDIGVFGEADYPHGHLPYLRYKCAVVCVGDYLYLIGGSSSQSDTYCDNAIGKTVDRLNLVKNIWERVGSMSAARAGHTAQAIAGKIYVFGGQIISSRSASHDSSGNFYMEIYDPELDQWEPQNQPTNFMFSASILY